MSNNLFNGKRFLLLCRQHFIHNSQLLLLATVAYVGVIFIVLSIVQINNQLHPHNIDSFLGFLIGFVAVFGILYVGHSFPAFRSKEKTINYLMVPSSLPEKFVFEFISRIGILVVVLPLLFWLTFHLQGYFFTIFSDYRFDAIGLQYLTKLDLPEVETLPWVITLISLAVLLGFVLAFTGAAMFLKQPLVKTLFSLAVIFIFYSAYTYIVMKPLGVGQYNLTAEMWLIPPMGDGTAGFKFFSIALLLSNMLMLFVAYRKLKEKEV